MKTSAILLAFAGAVSAASAPCDFGVLAVTLAPGISGSPSYAGCKTDSGYDLLLLSGGTVPTEEQTKKLLASTNCAALYKDLQTDVGKISPVCSIGGVDTTGFSALTITEGLAAVEKAVASFLAGTTTTGTNSTSGNSTTSNTVVTTVPASTTAAAAKSSAASAGVAFAAVAFTAVAALQ